MKHRIIRVLGVILAVAMLAACAPAAAPAPAAEDLPLQNLPVDVDDLHYVLAAATSILRP
jgi:hypothetical protein